MVLLLGDKDVNAVMSMSTAINVMEDTFLQASMGQTWNRPRSRIRLPRGFHHLMAGAVLGKKAFGLKTYTSFRSGTRFLVLVYDSDTGDLQALIQGSKLSLLRTSAVSAIAAKYMAKQKTPKVAIIGTGFQGRGQLEGICAIRDVKTVRAFDANPAILETFCSEMSSTLSLEVSPTDNPESCVEDADIIITMTTSRSPVLMGDWLKPGVHINAAGSNHWIRQEIDDSVIKRSDIIVVDSLDDAKIESGDLLYPIERGRIRWGQIHELSDVVGGKITGRPSDNSITLFESQGVAISDIAAAAHVYAEAKKMGLGSEIPMDL